MRHEGRLPKPDGRRSPTVVRALRIYRQLFTYATLDSHAFSQLSAPAMKRRRRLTALLDVELQGCRGATWRITTRASVNCKGRMRTRIIEVTNGERNWGKFLLGQFTDERHARSAVDVDARGPLLSSIGHGPNAYLVVDLQTCEGAIFALGGMASADLHKHRIWVCPLFEPFLEWLYASYRAAHHAGERFWWEGLPPHVDLPDAPFALHGYRRDGPHHDE